MFQSQMEESDQLKKKIFLDYFIITKNIPIHRREQIDFKN